jgi:hypothetical protein
VTKKLLLFFALLFMKSATKLNRCSAKAQIP